MNKGIRITSKGLLSVALLLAAVQPIAGCGNASEESSTAEGTSKQGTIAGQLLSSVEISPDHKLDFYEFGEGSVGVHESLPIGDKQILDQIDDKASLQRIYSLARPGAAVPAALIDAQARADEYQRQFPGTGAAVDVADPTLPAKQIPQVPSSAENTKSTSQDLTLCSDDQLGDNWGSQWFLDNFCNTGCFRNCVTDQASKSYSTTRDRFWWRSMNGDFWNPAHTAGYRECSICASFKTIWDYDIAPRHVDSWTMTGGYRKIAGTSGCHIHAAALTCD